MCANKSVVWTGMTMNKYPPHITILYPYTQRKNSLLGHSSGHPYHKDVKYTNVNYTHLSTITKFLASFDHLLKNIIDNWIK
jgi:hypothetical protein